MLRVICPPEALVCCVLFKLWTWKDDRLIILGLSSIAAPVLCSFLYTGLELIQYVGLGRWQQQTHTIYVPTIFILYMGGTVG